MFSQFSNNSFWIYMPPVILVIALAGLIVILGKKSGEFKKISALQARIENPAGEKKNWKSRFSGLGKSFLHFLEKVLLGTKNVFRKIEQLFSEWASNLRARRDAKKAEKFEEDMAKSSHEEEIIQKIEQAEEISMDIMEDHGSVRQMVGSEVIVRRKPEAPPVVLKKEPLPEDKVREAALIYRIAENPRDIEAYREIGDYYMGIGNIKDAKESFKMVLKLRPRDLKAKSALREIEMKMRLGS
ncbi:MAG: hypothetical protein PHF35_01965 [Candidatus Moranbacteria bacterium]|nr:hypothetical protein [Candidatus Moranbacteria bacterium]